MSASRHSFGTGRRRTDVIHVYDLIVTNLRVLHIGGDDEFVTSGYRNLHSRSEPPKIQETRESALVTYLRGRGGKHSRTSMPSLIRPVLISGPFCHAVIKKLTLAAQYESACQAENRDEPYRER